mmetsp:Transcript_25557/g.69342  ORF Transcript_25557/g.69342 Transcript_25557/m.69342 type:complete len:294 (+) Transcript_25557:2512-3393(+)
MWCLRHMTRALSRSPQRATPSRATWLSTSSRRWQARAGLTRRWSLALRSQFSPTLCTTMWLPALSAWASRSRDPVVTLPAIFSGTTRLTQRWVECGLRRSAHRSAVRGSITSRPICTGTLASSLLKASPVACTLMAWSSLTASTEGCCLWSRALHSTATRCSWRTHCSLGSPGLRCAPCALRVGTPAVHQNCPGRATTRHHPLVRASASCMECLPLLIRLDLRPSHGMSSWATLQSAASPKSRAPRLQTTRGAVGVGPGPMRWATTSMPQTHPTLFTWKPLTSWMSPMMACSA